MNKTTYFGKDTTMFSHELCQILDEVAHRCPAVSRVHQLRSFMLALDDIKVFGTYAVTFIPWLADYLNGRYLVQKPINVFGPDLHQVNDGSKLMFIIKAAMTMRPGRLLAPT